MGSIGLLFENASLTPHGFCLSWDPGLIELHVISDALIALSYYSIPICLAVLIHRRRDLAFRGVFWLFVVFIFACGTTHVMSIWTLWNPDYVTEGAVKVVTAAASVLTAALLWPLVPRALAIPSAAQLRSANERLVQEIAQRDAAETALRAEVAERRRAEAMLFESQKMEAIGQLTGGVAHDFNNMLTAVIANLDLLDLKLPRDSDLRRFTARALQAATRGGKVTQQLLAFASRQHLRPVSFDVRGVVDEMGDLFRGALPPSLDLGIESEPELWPAEADPNQLASALMNLLINARDATPAGGRITVAMRNEHVDGSRGGLHVSTGDYVAVSVDDTGSGMTEDVRDAAFEPFFTTKSVGLGTGLGLSQVFGFARQSRGDVVIRSAPGDGTTVTIYLRRAGAFGQGDDANAGAPALAAAAAVVGAPAIAGAR